MGNLTVFLSLQRRQQHFVFTNLLASCCPGLVHKDVTYKRVSESHRSSFYVNLAFWVLGFHHLKQCKHHSFPLPPWFLEYDSLFQSSLPSASVRASLHSLPELFSCVYYLTSLLNWGLGIALDLTLTCSVPWGPYISLTTSHN